MGTSWERARDLGGEGILRKRSHGCRGHTFKEGSKMTGLVLRWRQRKNTELGLETEAGMEKSKEREGDWRGRGMAGALERKGAESSKR